MASGVARRQVPSRARGTGGRGAAPDRRRRRAIAGAAIGAVVVIAGGLVGARLAGSSAPAKPATDMAAIRTLTSIPAAVFDAVGTGGEAPPFALAAGQPPLRRDGLPVVVYVGAEYCPYCAVLRYSLVAALSRFGTFSNLAESASGPNDGDISTVTFARARYRSPDVAFTGIETADRFGKVLTRPPAWVAALTQTYDGDASTGTPSRFAAGRWTQPGIPFLDVANHALLAGAPASLAAVVSSGALTNGGPGFAAITRSLAHPRSATGQAIGATSFIATANYISAAVCRANGGRPTAVCASTGVRAAAQALATVTPTR